MILRLLGGTLATMLVMLVLIWLGLSAMSMARLVAEWFDLPLERSLISACLLVLVLLWAAITRFVWDWLD